MKVKANFDYKDLVRNELIKKGQEFDVDEERGTFLTNKKYHGIPFATLVEEKPKPKRTPKAKAKEE